MKILSAKEVTEMFGISRSTIWRLEKENKFPARIQLSERRVGWEEGEIIRHLSSRRIREPQNEQE